MRFLSTSEYESFLLAYLRACGIDEPSALSLLAARWPLIGPGVIAESQGRGVNLTLDDVQAFCDSLVEKTDHPAPDARAAMFLPDVFDAMLSWLVAHGRVKPTITGELMQSQPRKLGQILRKTKAGAN